jgi:flavin-dependent dehydrogenase
MKYDLIIVGGGPGGLMAAKTAAEDGLKVILIERKKDITKIPRACSHIFFINKLTPSNKSEKGESHINGYVEPVSIEILDDRTRFHFLKPGFSLDYEGPLKPYYNWIQISPSGYQINRYKPNDKIWSFYYQKEAFLAGLLSAAEKAGAKVLQETMGLGADNTKDGVKVRVKGKSGEQTLEARNAIAADGIRSRIVESLGLNKERQLVGKPLKIAHYVIEGVETNLPGSWLSFTIPSISPFGTIPLGIWAEERNQLQSGTLGTPPPSLVLEKFMKLPIVAQWFRHARVVEKLACSVPMRPPLREPVAGNVLIIGDAGAPDATWIQGAVACGYMAVKAIEKELKDQKGYQEYIEWWQNAFAFNKADHFKVFSMAYSLPKICSDEEIDYIYSLFQDKVGIPPCLVAKNIELIKERRPELYEKLKKS